MTRDPRPDPDLLERTHRALVRACDAEGWHASIAIGLLERRPGGEVGIVVTADAPGADAARSWLEQHPQQVGVRVRVIDRVRPRSRP